jgi:hypothetical protein
MIRPDRPLHLPDFPHQPPHALHLPVGIATPASRSPPTAGSEPNGRCPGAHRLLPWSHWPPPRSPPAAALEPTGRRNGPHRKVLPGSLSTTVPEYGRRRPRFLSPQHLDSVRCARSRAVQIHAAKPTSRRCPRLRSLPREAPTPHTFPAQLHCPSSPGSSPAMTHLPTKRRLASNFPRVPG